MSYTVKFRVNEWISFEHWEVDGVTHIKLVQDRNPEESGSRAKIVLDVGEVGAEVEVKGLQR
jgi:hypothetical protein